MATNVDNLIVELKKEAKHNLTGPQEKRVAAIKSRGKGGKSAYKEELGKVQDKEEMKGYPAESKLASILKTAARSIKDWRGDMKEWAMTDVRRAARSDKVKQLDRSKQDFAMAARAELEHRKSKLSKMGSLTEELKKEGAYGAHYYKGKKKKKKKKKSKHSSY